MRPAQQHVDEVDDLLVLRDPGQLLAVVTGGVLESGGLGGQHGEDRVRAGAVALEHGIHELGGVSIRAGSHPTTALGGRGGEAFAAADGQALRAHAVRAAQLLERLHAEVLGEGAERGPLSADEAHRGGAADLVFDDPVVARDEAGGGVVVTGERTDAGEGVDDLRPVDRHGGEDVTDEVEEVLDLVVGAHDRLRRVGVDVGGAHQDAVLERVDEDDATVGVLEEDLATAGGCQQLGVVQHDVRALGAAHELRRQSHRAIGEVGPRSRGVQDDLGRDRELLAGELVAHTHAVLVRADGRDVVDRLGAASAGDDAVVQHVESDALRVVHGGVEVRGGVGQVGVEARERRERLLLAEEGVAGNGATVAREGVVHDEADLDQQRAALVRLAAAVGHEQAEGCREDAGERLVDRDRGLERLDVVRGRLDQVVALGDGFLHETELAVLEVADTAVDHVARGRGGARDEVAALDEGDLHALEGEVAEGGDAVDAPSDDEDVEVVGVAERLDIGANRRRGGRHVDCDLSLWVRETGCASLHVVASPLNKRAEWARRKGWGR
ncbi:hypothetical protein SRABI128_02944 [Microbacterium sp. Bi128]|nr:hypothetical protein SRABI128_02944 [Microbacterium sp. Bi128]